jgi:hypothetical protein
MDFITLASASFSGVITSIMAGASLIPDQRDSFMNWEVDPKGWTA